MKQRKKTCALHTFSHALENHILHTREAHTYLPLCASTKSHGEIVLCIVAHGRNRIIHRIKFKVYHKHTHTLGGFAIHSSYAAGLCYDM